MVHYKTPPPFGTSQPDFANDNSRGLSARTPLNDNVLDCTWQSSKQTDTRRDDEDDDDGDENLICIMRGNVWEALPYPIVVDSGAPASTLPKDWCQHVKLWEAAGSKSGQTFNAANGQEIPNLGRRAATLMTKEGAIRDMKFEVCSVTRALGSVSQMRRAGHRFTFKPPWDPNGRYIEHTEFCEKMWL